MKVIYNNRSIELIKGDITLMNTDAIVNAANEYLSHGGGVAGAILRRGGYVIQEESNAWVAQHGIVNTGSAAITTGGNLAAKYVIHAVGPVMGSGDEDTKLQSATESVLRLAEQYQLKSVAFPAISTGIFGFPTDRCARVMLSAIQYYFDKTSSIQRVVFCLFDDMSLNAFKSELTRLTTMS
jgi:O-acetyl-ADP-ribose deacetylase (regulator of RNase III)